MTISYSVQVFEFTQIISFQHKEVLATLKAILIARVVFTDVVGFSSVDLSQQISCQNADILKGDNGQGFNGYCGI
nr:hypothetical protein [Chromatium okenii]